MSGLVLDAYSVIAYLEREFAYEKVKVHLEQAVQSGQYLFLCTVNWGEVYYSVMKETNHAKAEEARHVIATLPIELVPADLGLTHQAALYKAIHKMSYADCFAAALAKIRKATLLTGDRDFKQLDGEIKVEWLPEK